MAAERRDRDAALRAILVERADRVRARPRGAPGAPGRSAAARLPALAATVVVLVGVVTVSALAIAAGQSHVAASRVDLAPPTSPAPVPTPTPYSGPLVAMAGARLFDRAQLHAWTLARRGGSANAAIAEQEDWLDIECMAAHGYLYDPSLPGTFDREPGKTYGLTAAQRAGYDTAFWGPAFPAVANPDDWRTSGCHGRSVHLAGQDGER